MYEEAQQQGLSRIAPNQEAADAEVETESVTLEQVAAFEEEIKSLKTKLAEKERNHKQERLEKMVSRCLFSHG